MPEQRLRDTLQRLHDELAAHPDLDGETTALLREVLADISGLLEGRSAGDNLATRLQSATSDFEATHPRLTAAVTQLADALSGMGI
jgi:hypothetical protein